MVEQNRSGTYTQIVYARTGGKLALMTGQTLQKAFIPLPGQATAVYTSSGLDHYRHSDWLGSARLTSSPPRNYVSSVAYAPFGDFQSDFLAVGQITESPTISVFPVPQFGKTFAVGWPSNYRWLVTFTNTPPGGKPKTYRFTTAIKDLTCVVPRKT
jgi:hypothetical protein